MTSTIRSTILSKFDGKLLGFQIFNGLRYGFMLLAAILLTHVASFSEVNSIESLLLLGATATFFFSSSIGHTLVSFAERFEGMDKRKALFNAFLLLILCTSLAVISLIVFHIYLSFESDFIFYGFLVFLFFNVTGSIVEIILLIQKQTKSLITYGVVFYTGYLLFFVAPFFLGWGLPQFTYGLILLGSAKIIYALYIVFKYGTFQFDPKIFKSFLMLNFPVMASYLMGSAVAYFSFFLVKYSYSDMEFNIYRYGLREFPLFLVLANSFSTFISGTVSQRLKEARTDALAEYSQKLKRLHHQLFIPAIFLMITSQYFIKILVAEAYEPAYMVFNIFLFTLCSRSLFPQSLLVAYGKNKAMYLASFLEFLTGAILSYFWLEQGINGMAWALVVAFMVEKIILIIACERNGIPYLKTHPWKVYIAYMVLLISSYVFF